MWKSNTAVYQVIYLLLYYFTVTSDDPVVRNVIQISLYTYQFPTTYQYADIYHIKLNKIFSTEN